MANQNSKPLPQMKRIFISEAAQKTGEKARVCGWVDTRRDHGKIIFIDLRDKTGVLQVVFASKDEKFRSEFEKLRPEWVVAIEGEIKARPEKLVNPNIATGKVELEVQNIEIISEAKTPPFEIGADGRDVEEELRLKYRYLDLRRARMKKNLELRARIIKFIRDFLTKENFLEVETPLLTKGTPEGAREFIVPSRLHAGQFYVLPQSPQQFKQLLMVAGVERYFQIARVFRDEDQRGDRQPEFTQLDLEMSFVDREEVMALTEQMLIELVKEVAPEKKIKEIPFPRLSYEESMKKYGSDKPDLRDDKNNSGELAFAWVIDQPLFETSETEQKIVSVHHPFTAPAQGPTEESLKFMESSPEKTKAKAYDIVLNGYEIGGGSIRIHNRALQEKVFQVLGLSEAEIQSRFGHILEAFEYGVPPHGGIAWGLDRLIMVLADEPNVREVIAFPKTGDARDPMTGAPSELPEQSLKEANIKIDRKSI